MEWSDGDVSGLVDRLAHLEGREVLPVRLDRRVERLDEELRRLAERLARIESKGATT